MASKTKKKSSVKKKASVPKAGGGIKGAIGKVASSLTGSSKARSGGGRRRNRGPTYWANKVLVQKLKRKYNKLRYGGM